MSDQESLEEIIRENILYYRHKSHFTQEELAEKLNISRAHISNIEGKKISPSLSLIQRILDLFQIEPNDLMLKKSYSPELTSEEKLQNIISERFDTLKINLLDDIKNLKLEQSSEVTYTTPIRPRQKIEKVSENKKNN